MFIVDASSMLLLCHLYISFHGSSRHVSYFVSPYDFYLLFSPL